MAQNKPESKAVLSTNNLVAILAICSLAAVLVSVFITKSLVGKIVHNGKVLDKKTAASKQLAANVEAVNALADKYNDLGGRVTLVMDALPTKPDFPAIVAMTEAMAGFSGVRLKSVNTALETPTVAANTAQTVVTPSGISTPLPFSYTVSVAGNYDNIIKFLSSLEISSRPVQVLSIAQSGTTTDQSVDIRVQTYYQAVADTSLKTEVVK